MRNFPKTGRCTPKLIQVDRRLHMLTEVNRPKNPVLLSFIRFFIRQLFELKIISNDIYEFQQGRLLICRMEIVGRVIMIEKKSKYTSWTICDGTSSIKCVKWMNIENESSWEDVTDGGQMSSIPSIQAGDTIIVRGKLINAPFQDCNRHFMVLEMSKCEGIRHELDWISETLLYHEVIKTKVDFPIDRDGGQSLENFELYDNFKSIKGSVKIIDQSDVEKVFGMNEKMSLELLQSWIRDGLIYKSVDKTYRSLPCFKLTAETMRIFSKRNTGIHPRFVWKCLETDGYSISFRSISTILDELCSNEQLEFHNGLYYFKRKESNF